jgi:hypothetical protein
MQIMITKYGYSRFAKVLDIAQCLARLGAAIDQVTGQPQSILRRVKRDLVEQAAEGVVTALEIANRVLGHLPLAWIVHESA